MAFTWWGRRVISGLIPTKFRWLPSYSLGRTAVELVIVEPAQPLPPLWVFPDPVLKRLLDLLLLALGDGSRFFIQDRDTPPLFIVVVIKDTNIAQVQGFLYDLIAGDVRSTISAWWP